MVELENLYSNEPSIPANLSDAKNKLTHFHDMEKTYCKQKAASKINDNGDRNTKYFHALVKKEF